MSADLRRSPAAEALRCALLAILLLPGLAAPAHSGPQPRPFSVHDTDRDGYLSAEEYGVLLELRRTRHTRHRRMMPQPAAAFEDVDRDGDGRIAETELTDMLGHKMYRYRRKGHRWRWGAN